MKSWSWAVRHRCGNSRNSLPLRLIRLGTYVSLICPTLGGDTGAGMIKIEEFRPHFVLFEQYLEQWLQRQPDSDTYRIHCGQFQRFLNRLQERVRWEYPLVSDQLEAKNAYQNLTGVTMSKAQYLLGEPQPTHELKNTLHQLCLSIESIRNLQVALPKLSEVRILNEILILISRRQAESFDIEPLQMRLPSATKWVSDSEMGWALFARQFPGVTSIHEPARISLAALKAELEKMAMALREADLSSLTAAAESVERESQTLTSFEAARLQLEKNNSDWEGDVHLLRARRENESRAIVSAEAVSELHRYFSNRTRTLANLRLQHRGRNPREEKVELVEKLSKEFAQLRSAWQSACLETPPNPESVSILLSLCANWETSFSRLSQRILATSEDGKREISAS